MVVGREGGNLGWTHVFERWSRLNLDLHLNWPPCRFTRLSTPFPCFPYCASLTILLSFQPFPVSLRHPKPLHYLRYSLSLSLSLCPLPHFLGLN